MKFTLKEFQQDAVSGLLKAIHQMRGTFEDYGQLSAVSLTAPTGSGKTVMATAALESLFFGNAELGYKADENACVLWLSDSPSLNEQTLNRFVQASDKLASSFLDHRHLEVVTNAFGASHELLDAGHVYFLSKDLLGNGKLLVKGSEANNGRVFWDIIDRTIKDPGRHLYLFIDEAHRGLGLNKNDDSTKATIYANLIDGYQGRRQMPVVVGISATPQRFESAMSQRANRTLLPAVEVQPKDVQESGLLKDVIELRVPEKDDSVGHKYLDLACDRLARADAAWERYCDGQSLPRVKPLLVVQVADRIGDEGLKDLCLQICHKLPKLDRQTAFANVFGEHEDRAFLSFNIRYVQPELVQETSSIRVLFAKEAISNGWDCPRAEVIFSERRRSDDTYIAQLIGRMVRTPLGRRVESDETLNSVSCFLPMFNPDATQSVVDYLTGKTDDIGKMYVPKVITNPVTVYWGGSFFNNNENTFQGTSEDEFELELHPSDMSSEKSISEGSVLQHNSVLVDNTNEHTDTFDVAESENNGAAPMSTVSTVVNPFSQEEWEGIEEVYHSLRRRVNPKKARNEYRSLLDTATLMVKTKLDVEAGEKVDKAFCRQLDGKITAYNDEFQRKKHDIEVAEMQVITIDKLSDNPVSRRSESPLNDVQGLEEAAKIAITLFSGKEFYNAYRRYKRENENMPMSEIYLRLAAAVRTPEILTEMNTWAQQERSVFFDAHATERDFLKESDRTEFDRLMQEARGARDVPLDEPLMYDVDGDFPRFPKHIAYDPIDGKCPLELNRLETYVVNTELSKDRTVAFYRNPSNFSQRVFSIPYTKPSGRVALHPDFIFFVRNADGVIRPSIVDPHGDHLEDALPKLKGYLEYLKDYPTEFQQVLSVTSIENSDELRYLNLLDAGTQDVIRNFTGDHIEELYKGPFSQHYGNIDKTKS